MVYDDQANSHNLDVQNLHVKKIQIDMTKKKLSKPMNK